MQNFSKRDIEAIDVCINCLKSAHYGLSEGSALFTMVESAYVLKDLRTRLVKHISENKAGGFDQVKITQNTDTQALPTSDTNQQTTEIDQVQNTEK